MDDAYVKVLEDAQRVIDVTEQNKRAVMVLFFIIPVTGLVSIVAPEFVKVAGDAVFAKRVVQASLVGGHTGYLASIVAFYKHLDGVIQKQQKFKAKVLAQFSKLRQPKVKE